MKKSKHALSSKHNDAVGVAEAAVLQWDMGMLEISVGICRHQIIEATVYIRRIFDGCNNGISHDRPVPRRKPRSDRLQCSPVLAVLIAVDLGCQT